MKVQVDAVLNSVESLQLERDRERERTSTLEFFNRIYNVAALQSEDPVSNRCW